MVKKEDGKVWYKSKTIWAALCVPLIMIAQQVAIGYGVVLPMETLYGILGAFGLYGMRDAVNKVKASN